VTHLYHRQASHDGASGQTKERKTVLWVLLIGAVSGGAVAFVWGAISWMALGWHQATFRRFRDEDEVARVLRENAAESGLYSFPEGPEQRPGMTAEERQAAENAVWEKMKQGPLVMAVIQNRGFGSLPKYLTGAFAIYTLASLLLTWLLLQTTGLGYGERVAVVAVAALAGAVMCRLPDWNWHGFPASYTAVTVADTVIGWTLVGLVLAAITP
jgi:hypothetical protein